MSLPNPNRNFDTKSIRRSLLILAIALPALLGVLLVAGRWLAVSGLPSDTSYVVRIELPPTGGEIGLPPVAGPLDASRPLVVIDAGHGGHDPGATNGLWKEKVLTLQLALALRDALLAKGGIRVALTRSDDRYLALEERSGIARRLKADLFLAVHADSSSSPNADIASGATIYTLSQRGSDEEASRIAQSENAADTIDGVMLHKATSDVSAILVGLSQRQSAAQSAEFARILLREGEGRITFRNRPIQSAAFVVLKSPDVPSALFEAGYISNPRDATYLASSEGQAAFAGAIAQAIRVYFARQSAAAASALPPGSNTTGGLR